MLAMKLYATYSDDNNWYQPNCGRFVIPTDNTNSHITSLEYEYIAPLDEEIPNLDAYFGQLQYNCDTYDKNNCEYQHWDNKLLEDNKLTNMLLYVTRPLLNWDVFICDMYGNKKEQKIREGKNPKCKEMRRIERKQSHNRTRHARR